MSLKYQLRQTGVEVQAAIDKIIALEPGALDAIGIYVHDSNYWDEHSGSVPELGALLIYGDQGKFKLGNGEDSVAELSFLDAALESAVLNHINNDVRHITSDERQYWNSKSDFSGRYQDLVGRPYIPERLRDLQDDATHRVVTDTEKTEWSAKVNQSQIADFVTRSVNDLLYYYTKSQTYTKEEVQALIATIQGFSYEVVAELPTASATTMRKIYLVPSADPQAQNIKDEYITIDNGEEAQTRYTWEQIGSTAIDLSGYVTTSDLNTALADYTTTAQLTQLLSAKQDTLVSGTNIKTVNNTSLLGSGNINISTYRGFPNTWDVTHAMQDLIDSINVDSNATVGESFLGTARLSDFPSGVVQGELIVSVMDELEVLGKVLLFELSSSDVSPYKWEYVSAYGATSVWHSWTTSADLEGKANKSEMSVTDGTGADADKTTIQLKSGTSTTVLKSHQDISGKADKVSDATSGNFAGLDGNGNLTDSGSKASDFLTQHQDITGKEDKSNKVSSWSSTTTDDHYPSEKLVKDSLDAKQATLVGSGTGQNIKTVNNNSLVGNGNIGVGTVTGVKVGSTSYPPTSGVVELPAYPSVPVTDVTVGGTSVVSSGTAAIPAIPDAVEANPTVPSGTTPTALTGLKIGTSYYDIEAGGGTVTDVTVDGTSVVNGSGVAVIPAIPTVPVTDVTVGGSSVVSNGTAVVPAIPDAVTANPNVPAGTTPTEMTGIKIGNSYYSVSAVALDVTNNDIDSAVNTAWV